MKNLTGPPGRRDHNDRPGRGRRFGQTGPGRKHLRGLRGIGPNVRYRRQIFFDQCPKCHGEIWLSDDTICDACPEGQEEQRHIDEEEG